MNPNQVLALLQQLLTFGGSLIAARGYASDAEIDALVGGIVAAVGIGWHVWTSRKVGTLTQAARLPEVESVVVTKESLADKVVSDKVTT